MNKVILDRKSTRLNSSHRQVRDPDIRYSNEENATAVARFTLAVDRRFKRDGEQNADFISCISFGKSAEFAEKYLRKGIKLVVTGRIQTGSYTNRDGNKVYTTDVVVEEQEFAESKKASEANSGSGQSNQNSKQSMNTPEPGSDGFMNIPDGIDEELPFN